MKLSNKLQTKIGNALKSLTADEVKELTEALLSAEQGENVVVCVRDGKILWSMPSGAYSLPDAECPYCGESSYPEGYGTPDEDTHERICNGCGKTFSV